MKYLITAYRFVVAMLLLFLSNQAWRVEFSALPFWRQATGMILLLMFVKCMKSLLEDEDRGKENP